jgi:hypothetical protein
MLYQDVYLADSNSYKNPYNGHSGKLVAPTYEELERAMATVLSQFGTDWIPAKAPVFGVNREVNGAAIWLEVYVAKGTQTETVTVASLQINCIANNCGTLQITNINGLYKGFAKFLVAAVINWAKFAGYTNLIGNTAGTYQNGYPLTWLRNKFGALDWGTPYKNARSGNVNVWFTIPLILVEQAEIPPEELVDEDPDYPDDDEDDYSYDEEEEF